MMGCQKNTTPINLSPEQQEISLVMSQWAKAWNMKSMKMMREVYTKSSPELIWLKKHMSGSKLNVRVITEDAVVFGDDALAVVNIRGGWRDSVLASFSKVDGAWKLEEKTPIK